MGAILPPTLGKSSGGACKAATLGVGFVSSHGQIRSVPGLGSARGAETGSPAFQGAAARDRAQGGRRSEAQAKRQNSTEINNNVKFRGRASKRDRIAANNAAHHFYAAASERPDALANAERLTIPLPKERAPRKPSDLPLERAVLADVLDALRRDHRVALVERTQSGLFMDGNRYIRVGSRGKLDITFMLRGGRYGEAEVKRPGKQPDPRQAERIATINANGGLAFCAHSAEEAIAALP